ncbi:regulatory protein [Anopheles sinensis]|uniref:Regulatory protein n=1 Tax=Anopheles sinensis TaxID=74873 RepID=A0A084WLA5_ANOSI|nr:regulatory protein [Anopheles sinensis]
MKSLPKDDGDLDDADDDDELLPSRMTPSFRRPVVIIYVGRFWPRDPELVGSFLSSRPARVVAVQVSLSDPVNCCLLARTPDVHRASRYRRGNKSILAHNTTARRPDLCLVWVEHRPLSILQICIPKMDGPVHGCSLLQVTVVWTENGLRVHNLQTFQRNGRK